MNSGCPDGPYVNHTPKKLLPCCASERPHPDSAGFHHRSVRSTPQLAGALPKPRRWICLVRETAPIVYEKVTLPVAAFVKSNEAVPTFVVPTAAGLNGPVNEGPVVWYTSPLKNVRFALNVPPGTVNHVGEPSLS